MKNTLAIIGATGFALDRVVPALRNSRRCEVAAIQGRNAERTRRAAQEFEIPHWYVDVEEMLGSKTYDAVYIATPPFLHLSDIETAMQHSLPIICEKPLCVSLSEALRIQALLRGKSAVAFMLAHHMRHQRALRELRNAITQGRIGEVATVWIQWGYRLDTNEKTASWKLDPARNGGGTFYDNGVHLVDLAIYLFGVPDTVATHSRSLRGAGSPGNEASVLTYGDAMAILSSSWNTPAPGNHLLIYGSRGKIEAFGGVGPGPIRTVYLTDEDGTRQLSFGSEDPLELYRAEFENFFAVHVRGEKAERGTTIDEAVNAIKILDCMQESSRKHQSVSFGRTTQSSENGS